MPEQYNYDTLDTVSINALDNFDNILLYNPYSTDISVEKNKESGQFGYETVEKEDDYVTKGIIKYNPERSFLKSIGIFTEDELPIVGFFMNQDKFKIGDTVKQTIKDFVDGQEIDIIRKFQIINTKSFGDLRTGKKVFILSPSRGPSIR